jgi:putative glutamine amidotransferase
MRVVRAEGYDEPRDAISHDWVRYLAVLGWDLCLVPNRLPDCCAHVRRVGIDALVLTGGNDLVERPGAADDVCPERTDTENALLDMACEDSIPVLAICRGLHVVNVHFGGRVTPDLAAATGSTVAHVAGTHTVDLSAPFAALQGEKTVKVNSYHRQGVLTGQVADGMESFAVSAKDSVVEGMVHREFPILAVQWHPERSNPAALLDRTLVTKLIDEGRFWSRIS